MYINIAKDVGSIIRDARKLKGWNQTELADKVGLGQRRISVMENDPAKVDLGIILQVCSALGLKLEIVTSAQKTSSESDW